MGIKLFCVVSKTLTLSSIIRRARISKFKLGYFLLTISLIISKVYKTKMVTLDLYLEILSNDQTFVPINYILYEKL
jgi:hypothetical protein